MTHTTMTPVHRTVAANSATALMLLAVLSFAAPLPATAAEPPPAAPAPGSPGIYVEHGPLATKLADAIAASKDPAVAGVVVTDQYSLNEVHRTHAGAPPAIHPGRTELHFVLDGSATFVTGGRITPAPGGTGNIIEGGVSHRIEKGDAVIVPANTPHWYSQIDSGITVLEVQFMAPASLPATSPAASPAPK